MALNVTAHGTGDWQAAVSAACGRLVHPAVQDAVEHGRQRRLLGAAMFGPFYLAAAALQVFAGKIAAAPLLALVCALFGLAWLVTLALAATGKRSLVEWALLGFSAALIAVVAAAAGGAGSPILLGLPALCFEPYWIARTRKSAVAGAAAAAVAFALQIPLQGFGLFQDATPFASIAAWIVPVLYGAAVWLRLPEIFADPDQTAKPVRAPGDLIDGAVFELAASGEILGVSGSGRTMSGSLAQALVGSSFLDRVHVSDRIACLSAMADLREGAARKTIELRMRLPAEAGGAAGSGFQSIAVELVAADENGVAAYAIVRRNREMDQLRADLAAAREQSANLEIAKGRFLAAVSHELRTPLNAIIGFSDMLLHEMFGGFSDPRQREYVGLIKDSGGHLLSIVNSILDVSRIESGSYPIDAEPFAFIEAANACQAMVKCQAERKQIALVNSVPADIGDIRADRRAVQQMLINLLSNAVKFTPEGGSVNIEARRLGSRMSFSVSDTGIGMSEQDLGRIGRPFTQIQNDYTRHFEGTGLGLSLVKGLVALHDGEMTIESAPGEGTTVTISLPVKGPAEQTRERAATVVALDSPKRPGDGHAAIRKTA